MNNEDKYQLAQKGAAMIAFAAGKPVQATYEDNPAKWLTIDCPNWNATGVFWRVKPEPVAPLWSKAEHYPTICWIQGKLRDPNPSLVIGFTERGPVLFDATSGTLQVYFWTDCEFWNHSTTRRDGDWHPCLVLP